VGRSLDGSRDDADEQRDAETVDEHVGREAGALDHHEHEQQPPGAHPVGEPASGIGGADARDRGRRDDRGNLARRQPRNEGQVEHGHRDEDAPAEPGDEGRKDERREHLVAATEESREPEADSRPGLLGGALALLGLGIGEGWLVAHPTSIATRSDTGLAVLGPGI
jgi:hypothetical protein